MEGMGVLLLLLFPITLLLAAYLGYRAYEHRGKVAEFKDALLEELTLFYPADLQLLWQDGKLSTDAPQPYYLDFKTKKFQEFFQPPVGAAEENPFDHVITIDTQGELEKYPEYKTFVLLTDSAAIGPVKDGSNRVVFYRNPNGENINFVMNKTIWDGIVQMARPFLEQIPRYFVYTIIFSIIFLPIIFLLCWISWHVIYLIFVAVVLMVFASITKRSFQFSELYVLGLYGSVLPSIATLVAIVFFGYAPAFFFTIVLLLVTFFAVLSAPKDGVKATN
jgi:hypothetical protein